MSPGLEQHAPDLEAIRDQVVALCAMTRSSARPGERESAAWLARRLAELGLVDVEVQPYRYQHSYALAHGLHNLAGVAAACVGGPAGAALALATLASYEREVSGERQWLRQLLPAGEGANVLARIPSRSGNPRARLVLVAHHDAANTGFVWHPRVVAASGARHLRRRRVDPFMGPLELALALAAAGALSPRLGRLARTVAAAMLALGVVLDADVARSPTVPGASDNATGVAACLDLAAALVANPLDRVEVVVALTGTEEAGMGGMRALLERSDELLEPRSTFVLGLDTLGAGTPILSASEGAMREQRYHERDLLLVEEGAALAGAPAPARWRLGAWTDPIIAVHRGLPTGSLLSMGPGYFPHYHHPSDIPEHIDWASVESCTRIAAGTIAAYERRVAGGEYGREGLPPWPRVLLKGDDRTAR